MTVIDSCRPDRGRAIKNHSEVLRALRDVRQARVAELMGTNETAVSRLKDGLDSFCGLLAAAGLKVVPEGYLSASPERIAALTTLAREALDSGFQPSTFGNDA